MRPVPQTKYTVRITELELVILLSKLAEFETG